jgi:DNA topoisomerase-1
MSQQWIRRRGSKSSGFRYVHPDGRIVRDERTLGRLEKLRVPPAWRDVHIARDTGRSIQAWGFDARGRKQYRYHARAVKARELRKYHRVRQLAKSLPGIRRTLRSQSRRSALTCGTACAIALRLISESLFRPGWERYLEENGSHGLTTMRKRHVRIDRDRAVFSYVGKGRKRQRQLITNAELIRLIGRLQRTPGERLFRYREGGNGSRNGWRDLEAATLTDHLRTHIGPFAVKDFRTWGGTIRAATVLAELGSAASVTEARRNVALAMRIVASELGNTPAICRSSYVHPMVLARYLDDGDTIRLRSGGPALRRPDAFAHSPEERALIAFLDRHFPERRSVSRPA